jgi:rhodanese-related sulfurtransferase
MAWQQSQGATIMLLRTLVRAGAAGLVTATIMVASIDVATSQGSVYQATIAEPNQKTPEASTQEVRRILADGSAILIDSRKHSEYVAGHIAGAKHAAPEPGAPPAAFITAVERLAGGDKAKPLMLYCNGQYCQASRQLSEQLVNAGFTNVRRYQLGIPMWRALNGPVEIELDGILRIYKIDQTALFFDARSAADFAKASLPGTHNVPADQLAADGLRKAPMPNNDFNTRIVLFGLDFAQARALADAVGKTPYQNVSYFPGTFEALAAAVKTR